MEPILIAAIIMVFISVTVIFLMTYLGYDVRSRGFNTTGPVAATLPKLGVTVGAYYKKRAEHPIADMESAKWAKAFLFLTLVASISTVGLAIVLIFF